MLPLGTASPGQPAMAVRRRTLDMTTQPTSPDEPSNAQMSSDTSGGKLTASVSASSKFVNARHAVALPFVIQVDGPAYSRMTDQGCEPPESAREASDPERTAASSAPPLFATTEPKLFVRATLAQVRTGPPAGATVRPQTEAPTSPTKPASASRERGHRGIASAGRQTRVEQPSRETQA